MAERAPSSTNPAAAPRPRNLPPHAQPHSPVPNPAPGMPPQRDPILTRRQFIRNTVRLAVAGAVIPGLLTQVLPSVPGAALGGGGAQPIILRDKKTNEKRAVTLADLQPQPANAPLVGEWNFLPATVYMVKTDALQAASAARGYNTGQLAVQHPAESAYSIVVYQSKCKHLGCTVGWNGGLGGSKDIEDYNSDGINEGRILCPCHQGQYDIFDLCKNVPGTPPPAPLNVIRFNVGKWANSDELKIPGASDAIIGTELLKQDKYREADLDGKAGKTAFLLASQASKL